MTVLASMMPVLTNRKRSSGFSIESIMSGCGNPGSDGGVHATCTCPVDSRPMSTAERTSTISSFHPASIGTHPLFPGTGLDSRVYCDSRLQLPGVDCSQTAAINANMRLFYNGLPLSAPPSAAVLAAANVGGFPGVGLPSQILGTPPPKEQFPFYTWLLARRGNYLSNSMHGSDNSYLFPFRKQKRIRTAFSPSQLLHLEKAFERNHYVVGQERKDLAAELSLTETQVKVWFQNRRTKYKRVQTEDDDSTEQRSDNDTDDGNMSQTETRDVARDDPSCQEHDSCSESEYVDVDSPSSNVDQVGLEGQVT